MIQNCKFEEFESRDHKFRRKESVDQNCDGMHYLLHILFWTKIIPRVVILSLDQVWYKNKQTVEFFSVVLVISLNLTHNL